MTIEPQNQSPPSPPTAQGLATDQPQPFSEGPRQAPGGCGRPLLIGCALTVVLLGLLLLGALWKARDLMPTLFRWSLDQFEQQVTDSLPADLSEAERQRLEAAFDAAADAVEEGTADTAALQRLQGELLRVARAGRLSRAGVIELIEALEAVAGEQAQPPAREPPPEAADEAMPLAARIPLPERRLPAA